MKFLEQEVRGMAECIGGKPSEMLTAYADLLAAQPVAVPDRISTLQFLSDVTTAAGLLEHGKRDKALANRIGDFAHNFYRALAAPSPAAEGAKVGEVLAQPSGGDSPERFKGFHRSLCERFGYPHDETFWWRDLVSLEEHIAALAQQGRDAEDAKRYRWLRDASMSERNRLEHYASHAMDTAIDAAIAASTKGGE